MRGYFRGLTSTWARDIPGYFSFFTAKFVFHRGLDRTQLRISGEASSVRVFPHSHTQLDILMRTDCVAESITTNCMTFVDMFACTNYTYIVSHGQK